MKKKDKISLYTMMSMFATSNINDTKSSLHYKRGFKRVKEDSSASSNLTKKDKEKRNKRKGLKPFIYGNKTIYAINKKNADKKAKKLKYIN